MYKVLLVDDEERVTQGMKRFGPWEETGFTVAGTATSVARALVFLESEPVDLLITDIQMPVQSGLDLIRLVKEQCPKTKAVILTAYSEFTYAQEALRLGAIDYLTKPVNFAQMKALLLRVHAKLDEENHSDDMDEVQEMLARTLVMNFANGYPYDEQKACACLDTRCPIAVVRMTAHETKAMGFAAEALRTAFTPCRLFWVSAQEILAVMEMPQEPQEAALAVSVEQLLRSGEEKMPVCVGVAWAQEGYREMRMAFLQAGKAMNYQSARGAAGVTSYDQISRIFVDGAEQQTEQLLALTRLLIVPEKREQLLPSLCDALRRMAEQPGFSLARAQRFLTTLIMEMDVPIQKLSLPDYPWHACLSAILLDIWSSADLAELEAQMTAYLENILRHIAQTNENALAGEMINQIQSYIQEHFAENLTLNVLSERFYVSPSYLSRLFKKKTGTNFIDYLTFLRVEKAKEYLTQTSRKIYHISEMIGYENPRYFAKLFKEATGCTPQEYRSQHASSFVGLSE